MALAWYSRGAGPEVAWDSRTLGLPSVSDTIRPYVVEGEVEAVDLDLDETITPRATEVANPGLARAVADTVTGRVTDAVAAIQKAGTFARSASDTITVIVSEPLILETPPYDVTVDVADSVLPVLTDGIAAFTGGAKDVTETIALVLDEVALLGVLAGTRLVAVDDTLAPLVADTVTSSGGGDVDRIRIIERRYGRIRIKAA